MFDRKPDGKAPAEPIARRLMETMRFGTLATATKTGKPEVATVEFCPTGKKDFSFYFNTFTRYRKYANLKKNKSAAFVVTDKQPQSWNTYSLQLEGTATEIKGKDAATARKTVTARYGSSDFYNHPDTRFFLFKPARGCLLDYETEAPRHRELKRR
jgi:general stress protein 26